jgi:NADPH:quinone reductase-like Zn-dependent oxidoreductase
LVTGAGSGVATFAVQIAAAVGSEVWVTTSSDAKLARLQELGARGGILYTQPDWGLSLREAAGGGFDAVVDSWGADCWPDALRALRWGGVLVSFGDTGGENSTIPVSEVYWAWRSIVGTTMGSPEEYRALLEHVSTHAWRPVIDSVHDLEDIDQAARRLLDRDRFGKIVLHVSDPP